MAAAPSRSSSCSRLSLASRSGPVATALAAVVRMPDGARRRDLLVTPRLPRFLVRRTVHGHANGSITSTFDTLARTGSAKGRPGSTPGARYVADSLGDRPRRGLCCAPSAGDSVDSADVTTADQTSRSARQLAQLAPQYVPADVETRRYQGWVDAGYFTADASSAAPSYTIMIPPPNVTGSLHIGHALDHTLIDALIRRRRMQGYNTLWLPGMDHAGIATQNVVERELAKEGLSRHDLGREAFVERVWQ